MRTLLLSLSVTSLVGLAGGCAHIDRARANYHEEKAERAAEHGRYRKAAREERKAERAREDLREDRDRF